MPDRNDIIQALEAEKAGLEARGEAKRAAEVDDYLAKLRAAGQLVQDEPTDAAEQRADQADPEMPPAVDDTKSDAADKTPRTKR